MTEDLARIIAASAFKSSAELNNLVPLLKMHCTEGENNRLVDAIASVSMEISQRVLRPIFEEFPDLERKFEEMFERYGRPG